MEKKTNDPGSKFKQSSAPAPKIVKMGQEQSKGRYGTGFAKKGKK